MAFYQKYRSKNFSEMVGQAHVVSTLLESVKSDKLVHAYLLTGPRGIGKTSTARLLAKAINCEEILRAKAENKPTSGEPCNKCDACRDINNGATIDVVEIDAASHTGVDDIRELIEKARLMPTKLHKKIYIIDEVHMLSKSAFNALLKTLEEPPSHVVFILATTEIHKIPATILSRAQRFDFKRATKAEIVSNLKKVAKAEKIEVDDGSLELIAVSAAGAHRDALGLLEQVAAATNKITIEVTRQILGLARSEETDKFIGAIFNNIPEEGLKIAHELFASGHDMAQFNHDVVAKLRQVLLLQISGKTAVHEMTKEESEELVELAALSDETKTLKLIENFIEAGNLFKDVTMPVLPLEMAVIKATAGLGGNPNIETRNSKPYSAEATQGKQIPNTKILNSKEEIEASSPRLTPPRRGGEQNNEAMKQFNNGITCPVPVVEMTKDIWAQIIEETKKQNATLAALLRDAKPESLTGDTLTIGVKFKFHKDRISEAKYAQMLGKIISEVVGNNCRVVCKITDGKAKPAHGGDPVGVVKDKAEDLDKIAKEVFEIE